MCHRLNMSSSSTLYVGFNCLRLGGLSVHCCIHSVYDGASWESETGQSQLVAVSQTRGWAKTRFLGNYQQTPKILAFLWQQAGLGKRVRAL